MDDIPLIKLSSSPKIVDHDYFRNFLDKEIEFIQAEIKNPGWTIWAIWVGLATLLGSLLVDLQANPLAPSVYILLVIFSTAYDALDGLTKINQSISPLPEKNRVYRYSPSLLGGQRSALLLNTLRGSAIILLAYVYFVPKISIGLFIVYGCATLVRLIYLGISLIRFDVDQDKDGLLDYEIALLKNVPQKLKYRIPNIIALIIYGYLTVGYLQFYADNNGTNFAEIRLAGMISAIYLLLLLLTAPSPGNPLIENLIDTRRQLGLGKIDINTAIKQTDKIIFGLELPEFIIQEYSKVIRIFDSALSLLNRIDINLEHVEDYSKGSGKNSITPDAVIVEALFHSSVDMIGDLSVLLSRDLGKSTGDLYRRLELYKEFSSRTLMPAIQEETSKIKTGVRDTKMLVIQRFDNALSAVEKSIIHDKFAAICTKKDREKFDKIKQWFCNYIDAKTH